MNEQLTKTGETKGETALQAFNRPDMLAKFEGVLGAGAKAYIQSALIVIADSPDLMECTAQSLVKSTLRSATLGLSLDPAARQGFLIPRWSGKVQAKVASFQAHYNGLYNLATRTGKYRTINVAPIHEGETVLEDVRTGLHVWKREGTKTLLTPDTGMGLDSGWRDVTAGKVTTPVIGYLGYFRQHDGFEKTVWMTTAEIHEHAQKWAGENYAAKGSAWKDPKKLPTMEMKTVFIALTKFMDLSGERSATLKMAIESDARPDDDDAVEGVASEVKDAPATVESIQTGPREPVKDETWAKFIKFTDEARELGLATPEIERDDYSQQQVNVFNNKLWSDIQNAKELARRAGKK